jgi:hypothetical protein
VKRGGKRRRAQASFDEQLQGWARRAGVRRACCVLILAGFALQAIVAARTLTPTVDEFIYVPTGYYYLETGDFGFDSTNPPLVKLAMALPLFAMDVQLDLDPRWHDDHMGWGPWIFGTRFMELNSARYLDVFFAARLVIVAIGVGLGVLVFARARKLLSPVGAVATLLLYATMPPLIAHGAVGTLDMGVTALLFAAFCTLDHFATARTLRSAAATGLLFGLAFAAKGVTALLVPLVPVMVAVEWRTWTRADVQRLLAGGAVMGVSAWVAVLAAYGFSGFPLPAPLLEGIRFQVAASSAGEFPAFLNGHWSQTGWWYYYLVTLGLKTPIATLVLVVLGVAVMAKRRLRQPGDLWMLLPPLLLLYALSFHYGKNYGVRYLLPAFPFLLLVAGCGVDVLLRAGRSGPAVVGVLLAWQFAACTLATPQQLAYFNEFAGGPDEARQRLLDSNLDWGQDLGAVKTYLNSRGTTQICLGYFGHVDPHVYGIDYSFPPPQPAPGRCAISANFLAGYPYGITYAGERVLGVRPGMWSWFDRLQPIARVGSSIYVFDVTANDVARLNRTPSRW